SRFGLCTRRSLRQLRLGSHLRHFLLFILPGETKAFAATSRLSYRNQTGNAKPRFCRAGPAADIALRTAHEVAALPSPPSCRSGRDRDGPKKTPPAPGGRESSGATSISCRREQRSPRRCFDASLLFPTRRTPHRTRQAPRENPSVWAARPASAAPSRRN